MPIRYSVARPKHYATTAYEDVMDSFHTRFALFSVVSLLSGCATMYPGTIDESPELSSTTAVVLVGVQGSRRVDYLQLCPSSPPCKNYRFSPFSNDVVALKVDVPASGLQLDSYTVSGSGGIYTAQGMAIGFRSVNDPAFSIASPGIFFHGVLNTDTGQFVSGPDSEMILIAKRKYGDRLLPLSPMNFNWLE